MSDTPDVPAARRITRLVAQQKDPSRVSVYLDGAFAFGVHQDLVLTFGLAKGQAVTVARQAEIEQEDQRYRARARAMAYLARKARTTQEVARKLRSQGFAEEVIEGVTDRLQAMGYLDDPAYARAFARGRLANRGYGPARIRADLRRRGIPEALAASVLDDLFAEEDLYAQAHAQAEKRWARLAREPDPRKRRKKLYDFLLRRGFTTDTVRRVVEDLAG